MIRIGANPIGWSNDDMQELGGDTPLEVCLAEAREVGFEGMELGHKFPREPAALRAALAPYDMACVSAWYSSELLRRDAAAELVALRPHLDLLKAMGSKVLVFAETSNAIHGDIAMPLSRRPVLEEGRWAEFGARITEVADATWAEGVRLVYHHHMGTVVQSQADIDAFMAVTGPSVHLLLDTGHATWGGADPVMLASRYRERISHVHTKDVRPDIRKRAGFRGLEFPAQRDRRGLHRAGRRHGRLRRRVQGAGRLLRLGGDRGRAGPEEGEPARLRQARLRQSEAGARERRPRLNPPLLVYTDSRFE